MPLMTRRALPDLESLCGENLHDPARFLQFWQSNVTRGEVPAPRTPANEQRARKMLEAWGVGWDLRARARISAWRGFSLHHCTKTAIYRHCRRLVARQLPVVYACQMRARSAGGLKGSSQFARLWEIAQLVEWRQPQRCLELGSGASSALFAWLIGDPARMTTVEESPHWHERLLHTMGPMHPRSTQLRADRVLAERGGQPVVHYQIDHTVDYDFVYVDGPYNELPDDLSEPLRRRALELDDRGRMPNIDTELLWNHGIYPRTVVVDGRLSTLRRLLPLAGERYRVVLRSEYQGLAQGELPNYFLHHTVLLRND
jgi:hypothetical protein